MNPFNIMKYCILAFSLSLPVTVLAKLSWQPLPEGIDYAKMKPSAFSPWSQFHLFKFNLQHYRLFLALASDHGRKATSVAHLADKYDALIAINGGFFTPKPAPIGLRIQSGKVKSRLKKISWWGVFYTTKNKAAIASQSAFKRTKNIDFAVQGGPRLIINGKIPSLKNGRAERSAVCITRDNDIILLATEHAAVTTTELAQWMKSPIDAGGLGCYNALNLDGGGSTQIFAKIGQFKLNSPGFSAITDAILVLPKKTNKA